MINLSDIPLKDIEALLGEKDLVIYLLEIRLEEAARLYNELKKEKQNG